MALIRWKGDNVSDNELSIQHIHDRVLLIEKHIEIERENEANIRSMQRLLIGIAFSFAITVLTASIAAAFAWGEINNKLNSMDFSSLSENFVISRNVLKDQSKQLGDVVRSQNHFQEQLDLLRSETKTATRDRYFRSDANMMESRFSQELTEIRNRITRNESFIFPLPPPPRTK